MMMTTESKNALPSLPPDHGFIEGDRVSFPVHGRGILEGGVTHIHIVEKRHIWKGLVILGDDGSYYELIPEITRKLEKAKPPRAGT